jgi:hypothetical protein
VIEIHGLLVNYQTIQLDHADGSWQERISAPEDGATSHRRTNWQDRVRYSGNARPISYTSLAPLNLMQVVVGGTPLIGERRKILSVAVHEVEMELDELAHRWAAHQEGLARPG